MRKNLKMTIMAVVFVMMSVVSPRLLAHCQIPCGIYDDQARFSSMLEDVRTIDKSMRQIKSLGQMEAPNWNQLVRWIHNKEVHAEKLAETITYYFMPQRIKLPDAVDEAGRHKYVKEITLLHEILLNSMKAKQTIDLKYCTRLLELIQQFRKSYLGEESP